MLKQNVPGLLAVAVTTVFALAAGAAAQQEASMVSYAEQIDLADLDAIIEQNTNGRLPGPASHGQARNAAIMDQDGTGHRARVEQKGRNANAQIVSMGQSNEALVSQEDRGAPNRASIDQDGSDNNATVDQYAGGGAGGNLSFILQEGAGNRAVALQYTSGSGFTPNSVMQFQFGNDNLATVSQNGAGNKAVQIQEGDANTSNILQTGDSNFALHKQIGDGLALPGDLGIEQYGDGAAVSVVQYAPGTN
jgi:hypothetical protein